MCLARTASLGRSKGYPPPVSAAAPRPERTANASSPTCGSEAAHMGRAHCMGGSPPRGKAKPGVCGLCPAMLPGWWAPLARHTLWQRFHAWLTSLGSRPCRSSNSQMMCSRSKLRADIGGKRPASCSRGWDSRGRPSEWRSPFSWAGHPCQLVCAPSPSLLVKGRALLDFSDRQVQGCLKTCPGGGGGGSPCHETSTPGTWRNKACFRASLPSPASKGPGRRSRAACAGRGCLLAPVATGALPPAAGLLRRSSSHIGPGPDPMWPGAGAPGG